MKEFWNSIQIVFTGVGGWLGWFLGGCDGLLYALIAFVVIDYLTGVMCAINDHNLSSEVGFRGICRKVLIFLLVGIANILDVQVIGAGSVLRTAVIFFYKLIFSKKRVAAYCRVSTGEDAQLLSLETQKAHYESWIKANAEWEYVGLYYDEGISGTKKETRPTLMRMVEDCEHGLIDYVVTKSISRFASNTADTLELVRKLLSINVPIFFEKENIDTGKMESELLLAIMSSIAESESVSISENRKWSDRNRFKNGTYKISCPPYGYDWDKEIGEMVVNPEQANVVRYIFLQTLAGVGTHVLMQQGIPSKKKGKWTASTINGIIRNEKYTGACLFQKTFTDESLNRHRNLGEYDQYYMENHHEAIITQEEYEAANALVDRRREEKGITTESGKYLIRYPFSGKIFCGECGGSFKRKKSSVIDELMSLAEQSLGAGRDAELETIDQQLEAKQKELVDRALKKLDYEELADEVEALKDVKQQILLGKAVDNNQQIKRDEMISFLQE